MKIQHLMEGAAPKLPGACKGVQVMTPQQFVAKAGDMPGEEELDEDILDEGVLNKIGSMALGLALAFGASHSMADQMYVYQDAGTQKLRIAMSLDKVPMNALMSFKVDTDSKTVDMIKGNQVRPVQVDPATVKQAQQQASGEQLAPATQQTQPASQPQSNTISLGMTKEQVKQLVPNVHDAEAAGTKQGGDLNKLGVAKISDILLSAQTKIMGVPAEAFYEFKNNKLAGIHYAVSMKSLGAGMGGLMGYDKAEFKEVLNDTFSKISQSGIVGKQTGKIKFETLVDMGSPTLIGDKMLAYDISADFSGGEVHIVSTGTQGMNNSFRPGTIYITKQMAYNEQAIAESEEHLARIRKLSGLEEATKLPASTRDFGGDDFQDYMKRIVGTPDVDKAGNVKTDKKGNEKYVSGKTKTDKYKMPYIHRSSVIEYLGPDGKTYDEDKIKQSLSQLPKNLLKQNEKMKHSNGELEQFFNVGFAALTGIAVDEQTNNLIIVNTCPGAGSCKVDCFAMKGGKVQFKAAWQSDGRILTYLLNDPDGFFSQLSNEISKEEKLGQKGGYTVTIRWHDAGDFFSPEYLDLALKMAAKHPDTKFYAYTKMAGAALGNKPPNFIINWSEGANTGQEKQVKAKDANLDTTKNSRIVPDDLFQDLLVKDEKKNLVKGSEGQWQVQPNKLPELKQRLASEYGLSANSILSYDEYMAKRKSIPAGMKYNVIVAPGEGDISANDPNIISTLLLRH